MPFWFRGARQSRLSIHFVVASDIDQRGRESFQLHYVEDLPDNFPSRGGTELLLPTIPLTLHAYRDLPLTPLTPV
jgi:hypothetical protein